MISMVILDRKKEAAYKLENCFRDISAHMSDERLALRKCEAGPEFLKYVAQTSLIHMAVLDFTAKDVPEAARGFRQAKPEAEMMVIADMSVDPMLYMNPGVLAASLILRPCEERLFRKKCEEFYGHCAGKFESKSGMEQMFSVENSDGKTMIPYSGIYYFEAREKKVFVRIRDREYGIYDTIDHLAKELPDCFVRCHRSYIINLKLVQRIKFSENLAYMKNDAAVPVSRSYKSALKEL